MAGLESDAEIIPGRAGDSAKALKQYQAAKNNHEAGNCNSMPSLDFPMPACALFQHETTPSDFRGDVFCLVHDPSDIH